MSNGGGSWFNAFTGGMEFGADWRARKLRENALKALVQRYGPEAGAPDEYGRLQGIEQRADLHPYDVAAQEQARQEQERVAAARRAEVEQRGVTAGDPAVQERDDALRMQAGQRAAAVLQMAKNRKLDMGKAFDVIEQGLGALGISPEHMVAIREKLITDPDSVDEFVELLKNPGQLSGGRAMSGGQAFYDDKTGKLVYGIPTSDGGMHIVPGLTPANAAQNEIKLGQTDVRLQQNDRKLSNDEAKQRGFDAPEGYEIWEGVDGTIEAKPIAGSKQEQDYQKNLREEEASDRKYLQAFDAVRQHGDVVETNAQRALEYFGSARGGVILQNIRRGAPMIAGTDMHEAWQALESVKNNVGIDELQRMRQSSPTGGAMGNVSDRDIALLQGALGRLDVVRDPKVMVEELENLRTVYAQIRQFAEQDAQLAAQRSQERAARPARRPPARAPAGAPDVSSMSDEELLRILTGGR